MTEPKFQYFYPDYSSDVSAASQMANFLLAASGEEEGKIPSAPTSEGVESCEFDYFSYVFLGCDFVFRKKIGLGHISCSMLA